MWRAMAVITAPAVAGVAVPMSARAFMAERLPVSFPARGSLDAQQAGTSRAGYCTSYASFPLPLTISWFTRNSEPTRGPSF